MNTFEQVCIAASEVVRIPPGHIRLHYTLGHDLGMDSLDFVEFVMQMGENGLDFEMRDDDANRFMADWADITIQQIVTWIDEARK